MNNINRDRINYNATDIQRYLNGQMSAKEMNALERAAMEDPFLADAIEGYEKKVQRDETDIATELTELRARIKRRIETTERKIIPLYRAGWMKIAAMILIVAGSGTLIYYLNQSSDKDKAVIAKTEVPARDSSPSPASSAMADTMSLSKTEFEKSEPVVASLKKKKTLAREHAPSPAPVNIARATQEPELKRQATSKDSSTKSFYTDSEIVLKQTDLVGTVKNTAVSGNALPERERVAQKSIDSSRDGMPVNGMTAFMHYIETNKKIPAQAMNVHGPVVVSFTISKEGILSEFKIEKSLSRLLDEEAIRLIKQGPAWKLLYNKEARASVTINF